MTSIPFSMGDFLAKLIEQAKKTLTFNPTDLHGLGVKNIHTYRMEIAQTMKPLTEDVKVGVFQLVMAQHNRKRILDGAASRPGVFSEGVGRAVISFISSNTVSTTAMHKIGQICTLKIDASFPDVCAMLYIFSHPSTGAEILVQDLVNQLWFASIAMDNELQELNKKRSQLAWNSWGVTSGEKKNKKDEVIAFDEEIYANSAADQIPLLLTNGKPMLIPNGGYTKKNLTRYIEYLRKANTEIPEPKNVMESLEIEAPLAGPEDERSGTGDDDDFSFGLGAEGDDE